MVDTIRREDLRLVRNIKFKSADKDNMEFTALVSTYQVDALKRLVDNFTEAFEEAAKVADAQAAEDKSIYDSLKVWLGESDEKSHYLWAYQTAEKIAKNIRALAGF